MKRKIIAIAMFAVTAMAVRVSAEAAVDTAPESDSSVLAEPMTLHARVKDIGVMRNVYLFSLRPEFHVVFGEINSVGFAGEIGMVDDNGLFIGLDIVCGAHYFGAGLSFGHTFNVAGGAKNAVGYSLGYYNTDIITVFESESGKRLRRYAGNNVGVTGIFWKVAWGGTGHIDLTNRVMFGYKRDAVWYDRDDGIYKEKGFTASYSVSAGYTLIRRR